MKNHKAPVYTIEMDDSQRYPYKGLKDPSFEVFVKCHIDFDQGGKIHSSVQKIISVDSELVIRILEVTESYLSNSYTFLYEYVPYELHFSHERIRKFVTSPECLQKLEQLFTLLLKKGITPILNPSNFGFSADFSLKYYIHHDFTDFPKTKM